jgi:hypothetical protein
MNALLKDGSASPALCVRKILSVASADWNIEKLGSAFHVLHVKNLSSAASVDVTNELVTESVPTIDNAISQ